MLAQTSRYFTDRGVRPFFSYRGAGDEKVLALVRAGLPMEALDTQPTRVGTSLRDVLGFFPT